MTLPTQLPTFPAPDTCSRTALLSLCALLLSACGASNDGSADNEDPPVEVAVASVASATFGERFSLTGTVTAEREARLSPRVDGLVARVHVDAGDRVHAGQVLIELDPAVGREALSRARAQAVEAEAASREAERLYAEAERLVAGRFIAATQVEARASALERARAAAGSARAGAAEQQALLERHRLPAPFDGVVAEKRTEAGEWVERGTEVLSLVATDHVRIDVRVPQERFARFDDDVVVRVATDAPGGAWLPARIVARVPVTEVGARTFLLRLQVDDPHAGLLPGSSARVEVALPPAADALAFDRDALLRQPDGGHAVFVVEDDATRLVARRHAVRVIHEHAGQAAVVEGLAVGQRVVVRGNEALEDGQAVAIVEH